jgi:hypothetical protein
MTIVGDAITWSITSGDSRGQSVKGLVSCGLYHKNMPIVMSEACTLNVT